jgi:hypothetical protein
MQVIAGIILCIIGVVLWLGDLSLNHAMAIFIVVIGVLLALTYVVPTTYYRRR